jgi:hypothetical protein
MVTISLHRLGNLLLVHIGGVAQLADRRMALELLLKAVDLMTNLVQAAYLIQWQTNNTALLGNSLQDALTNPPYSVWNEFESFLRIELSCSFFKTFITFFNEFLSFIFL